MGKMRARYSPRDDSSKGTEAWRPGFHGEPAGFDGVILDHRTKDGIRACPCGCGKRVAGKATFAMGHDMRLKGILIRAHITGTLVAALRVNGRTGDPELSEPMFAVGWAAKYSTPKYDWVEMLFESERKQGADVRAKIERANREVLARAIGVQPGDRRLIQVGRWEYTGEVLAVYTTDDGTGEVEYEYVTKSGEIKTVRKPATEVA
jgi:hypothetical protein